MKLRDRATRGASIGALAEIVTWPLGAILHALAHSRLTYLDISAVFMYGRLPRTSAEAAIAELGAIAFSAVLGAAFALLIPWVSSVNYRSKAVVYSLGVWFVADTAASLSRIGRVAHMGLATEVLSMVAPFAWGLITGELLRWLDDIHGVR